MLVSAEKRNSGIPQVGNLPWGSHFCQFHRSDADLLDILLPYLQAGVAGNEQCIWLTSGDESDGIRAGIGACLEEQISTGQLTVIPFREWHALESVEEESPFITLLDRAVMTGYCGIRIACTLPNPKDAPAISQELNAMGDLNLLMLCSYPHDRFDAPALLEVIRSHHFALVRKPDGWEVIRSSEARGMKNELKRQVEKLNFLYSNMSEAFAYHRIVLDANHKPCDYIYLEVNEAFEAITGLRGQDIVGKRVSEVIPDIGSDPSDWIGKFGAVALSRKPLHFENYSLRRDKWFEVSAFSPRKGYFAVMFSDITARKRAEEALRQGEERVRHKLDNILSPEGDLGQLELADVIDTRALQSLVDNFYTLTRLPMGLIDITGKVLVGVGWQKVCTEFHRANPESCANCIESDVHLSRGIPAGEYKVYKCKNNMWDVATPIIVGNRHLGNLFMGQFFFEDEPVEYGFFRHQAVRFGFDEDAYMAALHAVPHLGRETLATSMAFFMKLAEVLSRLGYSNLKLARSLSERNTLMEELRQAKEMAETATRTKSQFLANMSHELRTPMTGVLGMLEFALEGRLDHQQREYIETAHRSARSLLRILNDILDLTKVESGKFSLEERPFDLRACVDNAIDIIIPEVRRKGLDLIHVVTDDVPAVVVGDQMRLLQILTNLCGNAVKFTDEGRVAVRVACGGTLDDDRREIVFTIADSGIGIPDNKKGDLFKPFSQVDDTNTRKHGGTGLGLAISKEFVSMMGGTISCESADGAGSRFSFTVPFAVTDTLPVRGDDTGTPVPASSPHPLPETARKPRILLAEDDQVTRQILGELLSRLNFTLDVAKDGLQAVEMWAEGEYDLVLMDVQMPRMDGYAATREIRRREESRGGHSLIVAMTAHAFEEDKEQCRQAGMDSYISKPLDLKQCIALLNSLLSEGSA